MHSIQIKNLRSHIRKKQDCTGTHITATHKLQNNSQVLYFFPSIAGFHPVRNNFFLLPLNQHILEFQFMRFCFCWHIFFLCRCCFFVCFFSLLTLLYYYYRNLFGFTEIAFLSVVPTSARINLKNWLLFHCCESYCIQFGAKQRNKNIHF